MLVEDDNNLREIYEARLLAEGYEIVSAKDGEEALAMAVKEKPDLIISDVMMPKISGFDMLDILRSTPETKNTKVIMMTALSQSEDKARATKLGADRYLVKSQVTLEDVAKVAREVLNGEEAPAPPTETPSPIVETALETKISEPVPPTTVPQPESSIVSTDTPQTVSNNTTVPSSDAAAPQSVSSVIPVSLDSASTQIDPVLAATLADEEATVEKQVKDFVSIPMPDTSPDETPEKKTEPQAVSESDSLDGDIVDNGNISPISSPDPVQISVKDAPPISSEIDGQSSSSTDKKKDEVSTKSADNTTIESTSDEVKNKENNVTIANKKVIAPINDLTDKKPNLVELEAKENQKDALSPVVSQADGLPAETIIQPGGATIAPELANQENLSVPNSNNIIMPNAGTPNSPGQPSDVAL